MIVETVKTHAIQLILKHFGVFFRTNLFRSYTYVFQFLPIITSYTLWILKNLWSLVWRIENLQCPKNSYHIVWDFHSFQLFEISQFQVIDKENKHILNQIILPFYSRSLQFTSLYEFENVSDFEYFTCYYYFILRFHFRLGQIDFLD